MVTNTRNKIYKSTYQIKKMDCPSEEQMIRMKLANIETVIHLDFYIANRTLDVFHYNYDEEITKSITELNLDSTLINTEISTENLKFGTEESKQAKLLWLVLLINFSFFIIEMATGIIADSMGLVADSLDMFADAAVYGLSLLAIGKAVTTKKFVAKLAGYFQFTLAIIGFVEVVRRFLGFEAMPIFSTMIIVSSFALIANVVSLFILQKTKSKEAHMQASMIFTSNDIIINCGVIIAGIFVNTFSSNIPDLIIGSIIFILVIIGSFRILKLAK